MIGELRDEVAELLADAVRIAAAAHVETHRVAIARDDELVALRNAHDGAMDALQQAREDDASLVNVALANRDILGQAKGIIMLTSHCTADEAFQLLKAQSRAENRTLVDIASDVASRTSRRVTSD